MATFVLVHGMGSGGWSWKYVTPWLRDNGHEVYTPTLTGLGERSHLARPDVDFNTHVQDVVNVLEFEDLLGVILVGHSLGGTVIGAVAHRVPERIAQLIYLDAIIPVDGRSVLDTFADYNLTEVSQRMRDHIQHDSNGWLLPVSPPESRDAEFIAADRLEWAEQRHRPHPSAAVNQPIQLGNPQAESIPRTYITCTKRGDDGLIARMSAQLRSDPSWNYREIDTIHRATMAAPREVAVLLMDIAQTE